MTPEKLTKNHDVSVKEINLSLIALLAAAVIFTGCGDKSEPSTSQSAPPPPPPSIDLNAKAPVESSAGKEPAAPEVPVLESSSGNGGLAPDGLPTQSVGGQKLNDTTARLQYAVDYYNQAIAGMHGLGTTEEEVAHQQIREVPPLERLEQLVQAKIIRAIPKAPAGQKYFYDVKDNKVKLVNE